MSAAVLRTPARRMGYSLTACPQTGGWWARAPHIPAFDPLLQNTFCCTTGPGGGGGRTEERGSNGKQDAPGPCTSSVGAQCSGPQWWGRAALHYSRVGGASVGRVTCGVLRPTTEPPEGVCRACGLRRALTDPEGHPWRCTECRTGPPDMSDSNMGPPVGDHPIVNGLLLSLTPLATINHRKPQTVTADPLPPRQGLAEPGK